MNDFHFSFTAPAETAVDYEMVDFKGRLHDKSTYMGMPTNETDRLWRELYDCQLLDCPGVDLTHDLLLTRSRYRWSFTNHGR